MIEKLSIKNFKSIKNLDIECKKINLFIGEPNTGKSNILEALGLLSWCGYTEEKLNEYVRFEGLHNLFYDNLVENPIEIYFEGGEHQIKMTMKFDVETFNFIAKSFRNNEVFETLKVCSSDYKMEVPSRTIYTPTRFIKFYRFKYLKEFPNRNPSYLLPPHGENMFSVVLGHQHLRKIVSRYFTDYGFKPVLKPMEHIFEFQKQVDDLIFNYPFVLFSDTLLRMMFYEIAMESNNNSTLIFEEPESHAFPYYTKIFGESIGMDESNQYFIATHNPYLLLSILEKSKKGSVNVFITYYKDYQTKVRVLITDEISDLMTYDPFFNLRLFLGEEDDQ